MERPEFSVRAIQSLPESLQSKTRSIDRSENAQTSTRCVDSACSTPRNKQRIARPKEEYTPNSHEPPRRKLNLKTLRLGRRPSYQTQDLTDAFTPFNSTSEPNLRLAEGDIQGLDGEGLKLVTFDVRVKLGMSISDVKSSEDGEIRVTRVQTGGQADHLGVCAGWTLVSVEGNQISSDFDANDVKRLIAERITAMEPKDWRIRMFFSEAKEIDEDLIKELELPDKKRFEKAKERASKAKVRLATSKRDRKRSFMYSDLPSLSASLEKKSSWGRWKKRTVQVREFAIFYSKKSDILRNRESSRSPPRRSSMPPTPNSTRVKEGGVTRIPLSIVEGVFLNGDRLVVRCAMNSKVTFRAPRGSRVNLKVWRRGLEMHRQFLKSVMIACKSPDKSPVRNSSRLYRHTTA
uniref:PDZ domain-containing protein n=1 Tax=Amorphochlora amoebiformis TaxID=1561963 RepID=A0A7S0DLK6_9EUKA